MKKYLIAIAAIAVMFLTSCYVRVRESHPRPRGVIILSGNNTTPKDTLQSPASNNITKKDSLQPPAISEPAK